MTWKLILLFTTILATNPILLDGNYEPPGKLDDWPESYVEDTNPNEVVGGLFGQYDGYDGDAEVNLPTPSKDSHFWMSDGSGVRGVMMSGINAFIRDQLLIDDITDDPFTVFDIEDVLHKHSVWSELMPRVEPHYAVKANPYPLLLDLLNGLGMGFDGASHHEITDLVNRGVSTERIIFSHPMKTKESLRYAKNIGLDLMVFDCESELTKIFNIYPKARLVLRILVDDHRSAVHLDNNFNILNFNIETRFNVLESPALIS